MNNTQKIRLQIITGTTEDWLEGIYKDLVLGKGEPAYDITLNKVFCDDGEKVYAELMQKSSSDEYLTEVDADAKYVVKPTNTSGYNRVIGVYTNNNQAMYDVVYSNYNFDDGAPSRNGIAYYTNGNLGCAIPINDYHTANKKYVDDGFVAKPTSTVGFHRVPYIESNGYNVSYANLHNGISAGSIPLRGAGGIVKAGDPQADNDCVTRGYANANYATHDYLQQNYNPHTTIIICSSANNIIGMLTLPFYIQKGVSSAENIANVIDAINMSNLITQENTRIPITCVLSDTSYNSFVGFAYVLHLDSGYLAIDYFDANSGSLETNIALDLIAIP